MFPLRGVWKGGKIRISNWHHRRRFVRGRWHVVVHACVEVPRLFFSVYFVSVVSYVVALPVVSSFLSSAGNHQSHSISFSLSLSALDSCHLPPGPASAALSPKGSITVWHSSPPRAPVLPSLAPESR